MTSSGRSGIAKVHKDRIDIFEMRARSVRVIVTVAKRAKFNNSVRELYVGAYRVSYVGDYKRFACFAYISDLISSTSGTP